MTNVIRLHANQRNGARRIGDFSNHQRWVAWREEIRTRGDGSEYRTKIPYNPHSSGQARIPTDPTTWGTRAQAERRWQKLRDGGKGGVGIVLGELPSGELLMGIDLDRCFKKDAVRTWAVKIIKQFNTYAEVSPSGNGVKLFFLVAPDDIEQVKRLLGSNPDGTPKTRKSFVAGEHREIAIDLARYYAVTDDQLEGVPETLRTVPVEAVQWFIEVAGPHYKSLLKPASLSINNSTASELRDQSGSGHGFRFMQARKREGHTYQEALAAIVADRGKAGEWSLRVDDRQLQRAYQKDFNANGAATALEEQNANGDPEQVVLPAGAPLAAAEEYIKRRESSEEVLLLRAYRGAFYRWTGTHWRECPDEKIAAKLYTFLNEALAVDRKGNVGPFNPTRGKVDNVIHALRHFVLVNQDRQTPCWLDRRKGQPPRDLVACRNGILNLKTRELLPHDPQFFTMNSMPLEYDPDAPQPQRWLKFLEDLWPTTDPACREANEMAKQCLMEIIGYLLTPDTSQQKIFLIVGPKRGGKGTIVWVLTQLLGPENVVAPTLKSMTGEFGRWPLIDKKLAAITDARLGSNTDAHAVAEQLLSISGGDPQSINRKNQSFWNGLLGVRFLITTNELPAIADSSGTLSSRFILLRLTQSFYGNEDLRLKRKLKPELAGILNMALDGLDQLRERGHFEMPPTSLDSIRQLEDLGSPVAAFLRDWGKKGSNDDLINVKEFYAVYRVWCEEVGQKPLPRHVFGRGLHAVVPTLTTSGRGARRSYVGVALSADGWAQYRAAREVARAANRRR